MKDMGKAREIMTQGPDDRAVVRYINSLPSDQQAIHAAAWIINEIERELREMSLGGDMSFEDAVDGYLADLHGTSFDLHEAADDVYRYSPLYQELEASKWEEL